MKLDEDQLENDRLGTGAMGDYSLNHPSRCSFYHACRSFKSMRLHKITVSTRGVVNLYTLTLFVIALSSLLLSLFRHHADILFSLISLRWKQCYQHK